MRYWYVGLLGVVADVVTGTSYSKFSGGGDPRGGSARKARNDEPRGRYTSIFDPPKPVSSSQAAELEDESDESSSSTWTTSRVYDIPVMFSSQDRPSRAVDDSEVIRRERTHSILRSRSKSAHSMRRTVYFEDELDRKSVV